ncbi:hypothetical protein HGM15179_013016 [Zosterops borbonicus]|uniref:NAD(P)(+)--arginine ADP-ribosyltransferase n=1 Tax=Zosterops borbonicus TaxID=364589 RepID=A0A8K1GA22_9PASS|nr:hypothetical protein HGM15179_013016 [Zosterops borbonicus]
MTVVLPALNRSDFQKNPDFARVWPKAVAEWQRQGSPVSLLSSPAHAIALMAYTMNDLYQKFNAVVHVAGRSPQEYRDNFHFKTLHFLLTDALATLRNAQKRQCHCVYRGVKGSQFKARRGQRVRFGQFTSTSVCELVAYGLGMDTVFKVNTCYGVDIQNFSKYPREKEVLVPPFETFEVTKVTQKGNTEKIELRFTGTSSKYNCEWLKGDTTGDSLGVTVVTAATMATKVTVATTATLAMVVTLTTKATVTTIITKTP